MGAPLAVALTYHNSPVGARVDHAEHGVLRSCSIVCCAANGPYLTLAPLDTLCGAERCSGLLPWDEFNVHFGSSCVRQGELQLALAMVQLCILRLFVQMTQKHIFEVRISSECG